MRLSRLVRQVFLGFIRIHILHHAAEAPVCGVDLAEELASHGYRLSPGTLYPILHVLEASRYLRRSEELHEGRVRKCYVATPSGRRALAHARRQLKELVKEVLGDQA